MLRSPLQRLKNKHVVCSLKQLNPVLILAFFAHRCRHSTAMEVDCLLPHHGGLNSSVLFATSSDEIGTQPDILVEAVRCGLLTHPVGAAAASQQERLAIWGVAHPFFLNQFLLKARTNGCPILCGFQRRG